MRRPIAIAVLTWLLVLPGACGGNDDSPAAAVRCDAQLASALAGWAKAGFSGTILVSGAAECALGVGEGVTEGQPPTIDTVFGIGSVSKTLTGAAVAALVADGVVTLDDPAGRWLPELHGPAAAVTVEQLLAHTSGLGGGHGADEDPLELVDALAVIDAQELLFEPGTDRSYSNTGYTVLAAIVERASGQPFRQFMADAVLTPTGGERLGGFWEGDLMAAGERAGARRADGKWEEPRSIDGDVWAIEGNGSMSFSAQQLHDWVRALMDGDILDPDAVALMTEPLLPEDADGVSAGPGWSRVSPAVLGEEAFASAGGGGDVGHDAVLAWFPARDTIVVIESNSDDLNAETLFQAIVPAILSGGQVPAPINPDEIADERLEEVAGDYRLADGSVLAVEASADGLEVSVSSGQALASIFPPPGGPDDVAAHEAAVERFFAGETADGRDEVALLEEELGSARAEILGSAFIENELRTYVRVVGERGDLAGWIALDEAGRLNAVDYGQTVAVRRFVAADQRFVPDDAVGEDVAVALEFADDGSRVTMTVGDDELVAERVEGE